MCFWRFIILKKTGAVIAVEIDNCRLKVIIVNITVNLSLSLQVYRLIKAHSWPYWVILCPYDQPCWSLLVFHFHFFLLQLCAPPIQDRLIYLVFSHWESYSLVGGAEIQQPIFTPRTWSATETVVGVLSRELTTTSRSSNLPLPPSLTLSLTPGTPRRSGELIP